MRIKSLTSLLLSCLFCFVPATISFAQNETRHSLAGSISTDKYGFSLAWLGDVNNDGYEDFAVGIPGADEVEVISGNYLASPPLYTISGAGGSSFGQAIANAGDFNNDGVFDLVVGAPSAAPNPQVTVHSGTNGNLLCTYSSSAVGFGKAVGTVGDKDGDGSSDIIVGAPDSNGAGGSVFVYEGCDNTADFTDTGGGIDEVGFAVGGGEDFNGDGTADFMYSSPYAGGSNQGSVVVRSGSNESVLYTFTSSNVDQHLGYAIAAAGDINSDSVPDILIGAPGSPSMSVAGFVEVRSGANGNVITTLTGSPTFTNQHSFGSSVSPAGDLNQDGRDDVLVGARTYNTSDGAFAVFLSNDFPNIFTTGIGSGSEGLGNALSRGGDLTNDGTSEILIGAPEANTSTGEAKSMTIDTCPNNASKLQPLQCGCNVAETDTDGDGTPDCIDSCPMDPGKTVPGTCGCGVADTDDDLDGTPNCNDGCPSDVNKTAPGGCGCGVAETSDTDSDGVADCVDECINDATKTTAGQCGCGTAETDSDSDGAPDCVDLCPDDSAKVDPGVCGCGTAEGATEADTDGDGTPNCSEECYDDPNKITPGICGCGVADSDSDGDGVIDCQDNCPNDPLKTDPGLCGCSNDDSNTTGDRDRDGVPDCVDSCPDDPRKSVAGSCGCGVAEDTGDTDNDSVINCLDTCPNLAIVDPVCGCVATTSCDNGPLVTPETKLIEPPGTVVRQPTTEQKSKITISFPDFGGVRLNTGRVDLKIDEKEVDDLKKQLEAQGIPRKALTLKYKTIVNKFTNTSKVSNSNRGRKRRKKNKFSRGPSVSFRGLKSGSYEAKGRVVLFKNGERVGRTNQTPAQQFKILSK